LTIITEKSRKCSNSTGWNLSDLWHATLQSTLRYWSFSRKLEKV